MERLSDRRVVAVFALVLASGVCGAMLWARMWHSGFPGYRFLVWNLFLAWVPFVASVVLYDANRRGRGWPTQVALAVVWLLFLPNAPYIATDFLHVGRIWGAPLWYDAALVSVFAATGIALGFGSILLVQAAVERSFGKRWSVALLPPVFALCAAGIVLGRVLRLNSWDALSDPRGVLEVILTKASDPSASLRAFVLVALLTVGLGVAYFVVFAVASVARERT
jgi:uncharacterized membrane protein